MSQLTKTDRRLLDRSPGEGESLASYLIRNGVQGAGYLRLALSLPEPGGYDRERARATVDSYHAAARHQEHCSGSRGFDPLLAAEAALAFPDDRAALERHIEARVERVSTPGPKVFWQSRYISWDPRGDGMVEHTETPPRTSGWARICTPCGTTEIDGRYVRGTGEMREAFPTLVQAMYPDRLSDGILSRAANEVYIAGLGPGLLPEDREALRASAAALPATCGPEKRVA